jgi:hypothetical protein
MRSKLPGGLAAYRKLTTYHPNVDQDGRMSLDALSRHIWSSAINMRQGKYLDRPSPSGGLANSGTRYGPTLSSKGFISNREP